MTQIITEYHQGYYYTFSTISKIVSEVMYLKIISIIIVLGKIIVSKIKDDCIFTTCLYFIYNES